MLSHKSDRCQVLGKETKNTFLSSEFKVVCIFSNLECVWYFQDPTS